MAANTRDLRTLTEKGQAEFDTLRTNFESKIKQVLNKLHLVLEEAKETRDQDKIAEIRVCFVSYNNLAHDFISFLKGHKSVPANKALEDFEKKHNRNVQIYRDITKDILPPVPEDKNVGENERDDLDKKSDTSSNLSRNSTASVKAKLAAAKAKVQFAEQQAQLEFEKASFEARKTILNAQTEAAALEAELKVLEEEEQKLDPDFGKLNQDIYTSSNNQHLPAMSNHGLSSIFQNQAVSTPVSSMSTQTVSQPIFQPTMQAATSSTNPYSFPLPFGSTPSVPYHGLYPNRGQFFSMPNQGFSSSFPPNSSAPDQLGQILFRKDILLSRLHDYDDQPEHFFLWKTSFQSVAQEMTLTDAEQMDLLIKHLGPESKSYARNILAANPGNPNNALQLLWERLEQRYGRPEYVLYHLDGKLNSFPNISFKNPKKLFDLHDIVLQIQALKTNPTTSAHMSIYDTSSGVNRIINKLPHQLRQKWTNEATKYMLDNTVFYPPFQFLVKFIKNLAINSNNPAFLYENQYASDKNALKTSTRKTLVFSDNEKKDSKSRSLKCIIHNSKTHSLLHCRVFASKSLQEKRELLNENNLCTRCLLSNQHTATQCTEKINCNICDAKTHHTVMHPYPSQRNQYNFQSKKINKLDNTPKPKPEDDHEEVKTNCTKVICGRSCGKFVLCTVSFQGKSKTVYCMLDDQSNRSLISPDLLDHFGFRGLSKRSYQMTSCTGTQQMSGRRASGIKIQSLDGKSVFELPCLLECDSIPKDRSELPSSDIAQSFKHMKDISHAIPHSDAPISLLVGRDLPAVHHILDQRLGRPLDPFAQKTPLGWVIVGEVCLDANKQKSQNFVCRKTMIESLELCDHVIDVVETSDIFKKTPLDEQVSLSVDDRKFLEIMHDGMHLTDKNKWSAPLPFRKGKEPLVSNKAQALSRARILHKSLSKDEIKRNDLLDFMAKILKTGAAEKAPPLDINSNCWYLPLFGVYHPKKRKVRGVFDSSAKFQGESLNDKMYSGPDLVNSLIGILLRFRQNEFTIMGDVEQMFYQFEVDEKHRNYLRFFWYDQNDFSQPLVEYRMTKHVFGNSPSPAVATYGLRRSVENSPDSVKEFVQNDFYVDDGIKSLPNRSQAIQLMHETRKELKKYGINLHKIGSSDRAILQSFDKKDLSDQIKDLDLGKDKLPIQSCLGLSFDLENDDFIIDFSQDKIPATRRDLLSSLNSVYDPLGFLCPATINGKILLRQISPDGRQWDDPLSDEHKALWQSWMDDMKSVRGMRVSRMFLPTSLFQGEKPKFHIFCDASEKAIAAVVYVQVGSNFGFVMGKAKVAPSSGHTIPRLELCSAVLATDIWSFVYQQLNVSEKDATFYSDSRVVLGYISNDKRRFHTYVSNRVHKIRQFSSPEEWRYIPTHLNPADAATRLHRGNFTQSMNSWLFGQNKFLHILKADSPSSFPLVSPDTDKEIRAIVKMTNVTCFTSLSSRFSRFSSWNKLVSAFSMLKRVSRSFCYPYDKCADIKSETETFILKTVQNEAYGAEINALKHKSKLPKSSSILSLSPFLDSDGILRLGGRLNSNQFSDSFFESEHPIIVPKGHIAKLLVFRFHAETKHQGRHITEGAIRNHGFWIIGAKRLVSSVIHDCFKCRVLRGRPCEQKMADLPTDRTTPSAPFSHIGVDCFGPWTVETRRTRGGAANSKRWGVIFTCLTIRAIHIELVEEMSSSSFVNAFQRFTSLRGPVKLIRSDQGTNFVGASKFLNVQWIFNAPHSSHMGGVWERMIGIVRRILDCLLRDNRRKALTHEVLSTFMAEVCKIVNSRPITMITHDPSNPTLLTPATLLNAKFDIQTQNLVNANADMTQTYKSHYMHVQNLTSHFWDRWKSEYLESLQTRTKWQTQHQNLGVGDIVLLTDKALPRFEWPIGIITKVHPSSDKLVRKVDVRIMRTDGPVCYTRSIQELVSL